MSDYLIAFAALINGLFVVTTRVVVAKLGGYISETASSFWNHFVGFLFILPLALILGSGRTETMPEIPPLLLIGGLFGAIYVAINNMVFPKIGATRATLLIISGQIIFGLLIDLFGGRILNPGVTILGAGLVLLGIGIEREKTA